MKYDFAAMIPDPLPDGLWVIYLTEVFEIAGAVGLFLPQTRRLAGPRRGLLLRAGLWVLYLTEVFEIAGAVGLFLPQTRRLAGTCLVLLLVAMFSANVNAALNEIPLVSQDPTPLWLRTPMQLLYIGMVCWTSIKAPGKKDGRLSRREPVLKQDRTPSRQSA